MTVCVCVCAAREYRVTITPAHEYIANEHCMSVLDLRSVG